MHLPRGQGAVNAMRSDLVRQLDHSKPLFLQILEKTETSLEQRAPWNHRLTVGEALLTPTTIYVNDLLKLKEKVRFVL